MFKKITMRLALKLIVNQFGNKYFFVKLKYTWVLKDRTFLLVFHMFKKWTIFLKKILKNFIAQNDSRKIQLHLAKKKIIDPLERVLEPLKVARGEGWYMWWRHTFQRTMMAFVPSEPCYRELNMLLHTQSSQFVTRCRTRSMSSVFLRLQQV